MFSNFCGIRIQGKCFQSEVKLNFFEKEYHRFCLIYGKNGSGKSTISQAFDTAKQNNQPLIASQIIDKSGAVVDLTSENQKNSIFVFNIGCCLFFRTYFVIYNVLHRFYSRQLFLMVILMDRII